jgi:bifunctional UDP-N-acetylglucosamine pyrophosphorylase/glucosamine-1-phosphate N-acetyltransferase
MAAGEGTRMRSSTPKMLHPVCGRAMVAWPILAARAAGGTTGRVAAIVSPGRDISAGLPEGVETVEQPVSDGTGGAIRAASSLIEEAETVLVLSGDVPLISADTIAAMTEAHEAGEAAATMLTIELDDPGSYGRVVRTAAGDVETVVEAKAAGDADASQLAIREINAGTYLFDAAPLAKALAGLSNDNAQGEYYLPDVFTALRAEGRTVAAFQTDDLAVTMGINNRVQLAEVEAEARRRLLEAHMLAGVTIVDPASTWIDADVDLAQDVRVEPGTSLQGHTTVARRSVIGPLSTVIECEIGAEATVLRSHVEGATIEDGAAIGPFAYLRPGTVMGAGSKAGASVEIKNSHIGKGAKVPHLSYVGDADVGPGSNIGAGSITANYDGFRKNRTTIGRDVRIGVDTMLIAPVEVGDSAYTGAGAVLKDDVPDGALAVSENSQRNIDGYAADKAAKMREEQDK